ncbi:MAG: aminoacetone oxidase family FAD-binding enzyme, partial [Sphingomonadales bacterium]|nr:aminoacetone oxidase family FAD-binding enzyme [Sphingomonadales bacterium]
GYFTAIRLKELNPSVEVVILEKTGKTLSKLRISGGGRCNVTHDCKGVSTLLQNYPRGKSFLKKIFHDWSVQHTIDWFESNGVPLKTESDGRMFPESDSSETVAQLLEWKAKKLGADLMTNASVVTIVPLPAGGTYRWQLNFNTGGSELATDVVLAVGGFSKESQYNMIAHLGVKVVSPVPSLFTFNIPDATLHALHGLSVQDAKVKLAGYSDTYHGPLLVTHWGLSGPAVLKTSAWAARWMNERAYCTTALVSWKNLSEEEMREFLKTTLFENGKKRIDNVSVDGIPRRLWDYILQRAETPIAKLAADLSKFEFNKIIENLCRMPFETDGRTMFKEEFVTAGGIDLEQVNAKTMEIKGLSGLYATGEVLDIDGVTGGFNFQAAWSTAAIAAKALAH